MLNHIENFLPAFVSLGPLIYPIIGLGIFLEGEAVIYGALFLAFQGFIPFYILLPVIVGSVVLTDFISYQIGRFGPRLFPRLARAYGTLTEPMDERLHTLSIPVYMISKFTYGFHRAVLIRSGMIGIPFKKLMLVNFITATVWIGTIAGLAFASWKSLGYVRKSFHYVEITLLIGVIGVLIGSHILSHFTKMKLLNDAEKHKNGK